MQSVLKDLILPQLISKFPATSRFGKLLMKLNSNLFFANSSQISLGEIARKVSNSENFLYQNRTIAASGMLAAIDKRLELGQFSSRIQILGKRFLATDTSANTGIQLVEMQMVYNNFLMPKLSKGLGQLVQSGIYDRWSILHNLRYDLSLVQALGNNSFF